MTSLEHEHGDGQEVGPTTAYPSAAVAATAILRYAHAKRSGLYSILGEQCPAPDWPAAAAAITAGASTLPLDEAAFRQLEAAIQEAPDREAGEAMRSVTRSWAEANWTTVEAGLRQEALKRFRKASYDFDEFVARWPRLQTDCRLLADAIQAIEQGSPTLDAGVAQLRVLNGDQPAAADVLAAVMARRTSLRERDDFASLFAEWAGDGVWGQLQHLLWRVGAKTYRKQTVLTDLPCKVLKIAELLREFGLSIGAAPYYALSELSAETKASWRRELKAVIGDDPALRRAVTEALLWFGSMHDDRAVLFAVLELYDNGLETALAPFRGHPDGLVRRRAVATIDLARREPDAMELLRSRYTTATPSHPATADGLGPVRTWIGDARVERLIEDALDDAARSAGSDISRTLASGEETHVTVLFERLRGAFSAISDRLAALAVETNGNERLSLKLEHRVVGKPEEGGLGVGTKRFSADVCLLIEARDSGKRFARRASLLQAKRLYRRRSALDVNYYPVDTSQLENLAGQTMASFLLLVGPECNGVSIPVIPARLFLDLVERGQPSTQIAPDDASRLGKGIGAWLVEDVIGLWTGDWMAAIVNRAEGGKDREPFLLVEMVVERVRKGPDGWVS